MLQFKELEEGKTYYAKYISLYEDEDKVLWCEDDFTIKKQSGRMCYDHTIAVVKTNGQLFHTNIPCDVTVTRGHPDEWGINIHGPDMEKFMRTKIGFANPLPFEIVNI